MVDELKAKDRKNAKALQMGGVQQVSRSGEKGWNDDKVLSSLAVSPQNYEIFDFHTIDSPVFAGGGKQIALCLNKGKYLYV